MFTGIVEELGRVRSVTPQDGGARLVIEAETVLSDAELGASIAVNGCCLTVVALDERTWSADAVIESLARTNLGDLGPGDAVNLERPVRLADRLGGHLVQGHVDATGTVRSREPQPDGSTLITVDAPPDVMRYVVHKGSITVDGVSLTVARRRRRCVRGRVDPAHARGHDAGHPRGGCACEPRSRPDRQVRGSTSCAPRQRVRT